MPVSVSIRFPLRTHEGMKEHKEETGVTTNAFVIRAVEEKLVQEGILPPSTRRKSTVKSA